MRATVAIALGLVLAGCSKEPSHPPVLEEQGTNPGGGLGPAHDGGAVEAGGATGLLATVATPTGLALDALNVYVASSAGAIVRAPRGGGAVDTLATGVRAPGALAATGAALFVLDGDGIATTPLAQPAVTVFAPDAIAPSAIAVTATDVYWIELEQLGSAAIELATRPIAGGAKRVVATHAGQTLPGPLVLWNGYAYFGASDPTSGVLLRAQLTAGGDPAETFAVVPDGQIADLATDGATLYVAAATALNGGKIQSTPLSGGGAVTTLASDAGGPSHLAVKNGTVYWTAVTAGEIRSVPAAGGDMTTRATNVVAPGWIAVDDAVYATFRDGVLRLPR